MNEPNDPFKDDADSIYRAPESDTTQAPKEDLLAAFLGPKNAQYYEQRFRRFEEQNSVVSWNWPAFFFGFFWLLYRKMWLFAVLYLFVLPIVQSVLLVALIAILGSDAGTTLYFLIWFLTSYIALPMFANWLYYRHAQGKLQKAATMSASPDQQALQLARTGGTSSVALVVLPLLLVFFVGILAAIAIPAYQDYTIRAQVSEGLMLSGGAKAAVIEYFMDTRQFPPDNAAAGVAPADAISGKYVASVEVYDGSVYITYGNAAHSTINGNDLVMTPTESAGSISWSCSSESIAPKHLPAACR